MEIETLVETTAGGKAGVPPGNGEVLPGAEEPSGRLHQAEVADLLVERLDVDVEDPGRTRLVPGRRAEHALAGRR